MRVLAIAGRLVLFAAAALWALVPGSAPAAVTYPGPGWRVASPKTAITFVGVDAARLAGVEVTGSVSGPHTGRIHALRLERGGVFTPDRRFVRGEQVTVRPDPGVMAPFTFTVGDWGGSTIQRVDLGPASRLSPGPSTAGIRGCDPERHRYRTLPDLRPVDMCVIRPGAGGGRVFVTPRSHPERRRRDQHSVMMLSDRGDLLWYSAVPFVARDLKTVRYRGRRMLAYYQWVPHGRAHYALVDGTYRLVRRIRAGNGYVMNTHELQLTPRGTAYLWAYQPVRLPGFATPVMDVVLQEIDPETRDVVFEWHSLDHVPPSASYQLPPSGRGTWDYFHGNSIDPPVGRRGTIVVSARNTSAVYGIDRRTGAVRWTLGGKQDEFGSCASARSSSSAPSTTRAANRTATSRSSTTAVQGWGTCSTARSTRREC